MQRGTLITVVIEMLDAERQVANSMDSCVKAPLLQRGTIITVVIEMLNAVRGSKSKTMAYQKSILFR